MKPALWLKLSDANFASELQALVDRRHAHVGSTDIGETVRDIITAIQTRGDVAAFELTQKYDGV